MRRLIWSAAVAATIVVAAACGGDGATTAPTTAASPTSAPDVVTTEGGFVIGGYEVISVDPAELGLTVPPDLEGATGYRYAKGPTEVAVGIQGLLPESVPPNDANLQRVLVEVSGGGTPHEVALGEQRGFQVDGSGGLVYIGSLLEDGTVNVVRGTDKDALVDMLAALNTATSSAQ